MTVTYYWYDHLLLRENGDAEKVQKAIKEHDFETFMFYYNKYQTNRKDDLIFFPKLAHIWENDDCIGQFCVLTKGGFNKITDSEFECG